jgi:hypothetical protein
MLRSSVYSCRTCAAIQYIHNPSRITEELVIHVEHTNVRNKLPHLSLFSPLSYKLPTQLLRREIRSHSHSFIWHAANHRRGNQYMTSERSFGSKFIFSCKSKGLIYQNRVNGDKNCKVNTNSSTSTDVAAIQQLRSSAQKCAHVGYFAKYSCSQVIYYLSY